MKRNKATSLEHQKGVIFAERLLTSKGFIIKSLPIIDDYQPDIYAEKINRDAVEKVVIEVETIDSITDPHSYKQMKAFCKWSAEYQTRSAVLVVPESGLIHARKHLPNYDNVITF